MTSYITSTFEQSTSVLSTQLSKLVTTSKTGATVGAILGLSVGLCDYLKIKKQDAPGAGAMSIFLPTYFGYLIGVMPRLGVTVAVIAFSMNEYNNHKHSHT
jgi:uncharacterized membrane protein